MSDPRIDEVLDFWFGLTPQQWFEKDPAFDEKVRTRFLSLHEEAARGELDTWTHTSRGALALLVLLDQFPRNMFRDTPRAFATDPAALVIARAMNLDDLPPNQRCVALLPYQHVEDLAIQDEGIARYERVAAQFPDEPFPKMAVDFAKKHRAVIERFGRFPHRNKILGRESTAEELAFLAEPGSSF